MLQNFVKIQVFYFGTHLYFKHLYIYTFYDKCISLCILIPFIHFNDTNVFLQFSVKTLIQYKRDVRSYFKILKSFQNNLEFKTQKVTFTENWRDSCILKNYACARVYACVSASVTKQAETAMPEIPDSISGKIEKFSYAYSSSWQTIANHWVFLPCVLL